MIKIAFYHTFVLNQCGVHLLVWNIINFVYIFFNSKVYFLKQYHQKIMVRYVRIEMFISIHFLFNFLILHLSLLYVLTQVNKHLLRHQKHRFFSIKIQSLFGISYLKFCDVRMKRWALTSKEDHNFWLSLKFDFFKY